MQMTSFDFFISSINEYNFMTFAKMISYNFVEYIVYDVIDFKYVFDVVEFVSDEIVTIFILSLMSFSSMYM